MKRFSIIVTLAVLALASFGTGCSSGGGDQAKMIAKKWQVADIHTPEMDTMSADNKQMMKSMMSSITMEFKSDNTTITSMMGMSTTGKWKIDNGTVILTDSAGKENKGKIIELTDKKFVIEMSEKGKTAQLTLEPAGTASSTPPPSTPPSAPPSGSSDPATKPDSGTGTESAAGADTAAKIK